MKKIYQEPTIKVVAVRMASMVAGSVETLGETYDSGTYNSESKEECEDFDW